MTTSADDEAAPTLGALRAAVEGRPAISRRHRSWRQRLRLPLMLFGPIIVLVAGGWWYLTSGQYVSTDDAYVDAARVSISNEISGRVATVDVHDNERVKAGQVLFTLDQRPFRIAVEEAKAQLAAVKLQIEAMKATYQEKKADAAATEATLMYQQRELQRQQRLLSTGTASQSQYDQTNHAYKIAREQLAAKAEDVASALASLGGDPDIPVDDHPMVQHAQAALDRAELNLSYTVVRAPEDGIVTKVDQLQVGDWVQGVDTGSMPTTLFSLVSAKRIWVTANFKETQLTHMHPGQDATIAIDTYPDVVFHAKVQSLSPGTGLTFSLLPAENATGNWVKVVQRLPVRLSFDKLDPRYRLAAGLSADVEVDTGYHRPMLERVKQLFGWLDDRTTQTAAR
ncbi:MAG TPA: HlyD family secretion protein [Stellaceae bacterium]|nr:HlyD family secretion protein [Stellaceae bacterium]